MNLRRSLLVAFFLLTALSPSFGQGTRQASPHQPPQQQSVVAADLKAPLPFDTTVLTGTLKNGLRYYIRPNHRPEKRAELRLVVNAGSMQEDDNQRGLAHVCEHMAFDGTTHFKKQELINYLESIGMRFGPDVNAYTSFDETVYMLELPTDTASFMQQGFQILEDWAHGVTYDDSEITRERKVVIEEWRLGRGADARLRDKEFPLIFKGSRYADRLPIGDVHILESFDHALLRKFYRDWYRPDLMAVVAVGDFDTSAIKQLIINHFENLVNPERERPRIFYPVPNFKQTLYTIATDSEETSTGIGIYFKRDTMPQWSHGDYRRQLVDGLYIGMLNQRLAELARLADPPYLYGSASVGRLVRTKAAFMLSASVKENGMLQGFKTVLTEAERARKYGFNQSEMDRLRTEQLRGMENAYAERNKTESESYASELIRNFLNQEPVPGLPYEYQLYQAYLPAITLAEVNALSERLMPDSNRIIAADGPQKAGVNLPTQGQLQAVMDSIAQQEITQYVDTVSSKPLVASLPPAGTIADEKTRPDIGTTEWRLSNGIRVILKPTDFKNDEIQFTAFSPGGTSLAPDSLYIPASTASAVVEQGGIDGFDLVSLEKKLAGKLANASPYIDELYQGVSGSSSVKDAETMFQLIYLYFTEPRKDSTAFLSYKTRIRGVLENRSASPEAAFSDTLQVTLAQHHPRRLPWTLETLDKLNLQRSMDFYRQRFADAGDFTFIFVGSFSIDSMKPFILQYLGSLPSLKRNDHWRDIGVTPPRGVVVKTVHRGIEPKSSVRIYFNGPIEWSVKNRFAVSTLGDAMAIKLREALREERGGTYGVGVNGSASEFPKPVYNLTISFGCDPARTQELINATFAVIDSVRRFGLPETNLEKVKETQRRERETGLKQNGFWLSYLEFYYMHNEDPGQILHLEDRLKWLTTDFLRDAAEKYFNEKNYVEGVLLPEKTSDSH